MSEVAGHVPVMLKEVLDAAAVRDGEICVDGTFGAGGYSRALLEVADCQVIGIDRDPEAAPRAVELEQAFSGRFRFLEGNFGQMDRLMAQAGEPVADVVVLDIGVSSFQIDDPMRGFSFQKDGPLDMRMERAGESAAEVVNTRSESELADIIYLYGEERASRRIARRIVEARKEEPIESTTRLAEIVRAALGKQGKGQRIDPATRTFQALRIYVNGELDALEQGLQAAERLLRAGGRLVVVTFHSLEDRIVKRFFKLRSGGEQGMTSRYLPAPQQEMHSPSFMLIKRKAVEASEEEARQNSRARSAKLRAAYRTDAPVWEVAA